MNEKLIDHFMSAFLARQHECCSSILKFYIQFELVYENEMNIESGLELTSSLSSITICLFNKNDCKAPRLFSFIKLARERKHNDIIDSVRCRLCNKIEKHISKIHSFKIHKSNGFFSNMNS